MAWTPTSHPNSIVLLGGEDDAAQDICASTAPLSGDSGNVFIDLDAIAFPATVFQLTSVEVCGYRGHASLFLFYFI